MRDQLASARRICFDSNALIYHLNRNEPYAQIVKQLLDEIRNGAKEGFVSVITELELLVRPIREADFRAVERIKALLDADTVHVVELDRAIARRAAEVRATRHLDLADATVVATALVTNCDAVVGNDERCAQRVRDIPYVFLDALVKERRP